MQMRLFDVEAFRRENVLAKLEEFSSQTYNPGMQNKESVKETIRKWREENPRGHRADLYNSGLVSRSSVDRWWDKVGINTTPLTAEEKVYTWRNENPKGTKAACIRETGVSKKWVYKKWNRKPMPKEPEKIEIKIEPNGQLFFDL